MALQCSDTMPSCRSGYQRRTCTLAGGFRSFKKKTDIVSTQTRWTDKALEVDVHVWCSGKKVLHDFATRVTSQPVSIGSAERCWKAYANINCAKRNRLDPERAAKLTCAHCYMRPRHEGGTDLQKRLSDGAGSNRP